MDRAQELMRDAKTIAIVGADSRPDRAVYGVTKFLMSEGYKIYLVNPRSGETEILGLPTYEHVSDLPEAVDIVDIFRRPSDVMPFVEDAIASGAKAVWLQLAIVNEEAAEKARAAGLEVVMDRCTAIERRAMLRAQAAGE